MPLSLDEHKRLMTMSARGKNGPETIFDRGYESGMNGTPQDRCPHKLKLARVEFGGREVMKEPSRQRLAWLDGWEEGSAARQGRLIELMRARLAQSS